MADTYDWDPSRSLAPLRPYLARIAHDVAVRRARGEADEAAIIAAVEETLLAQGYGADQAKETAARLASQHGAMLRAYAAEHDRMLANDRAQGFHVNH